MHLNQKGSPREAGIAHILLIIFLLTAIGIGVYLVQKEGFLKFKSRAYTSEVLEGLELLDADGKALECDQSTTPPTCYTQTLNIQVRVKDQNAFTSKDAFQQNTEDNPSE